jgi:plasmid stabilization system protein ParE
MAFKLEISVEAPVDVEAAVDWYNDQLPRLGGKFLIDFRNTLRYIVEHQYSFRKFNTSNREAGLLTFPYLIIYKVEVNKITVLGVINTHQNPTKKL